MPYARIRVSLELLREVLHFPFGTEIKLVAMVRNAYGTEAELTVSHPDLKNEESIPLITPTFRRQEPVVFVDWGQK
jgi:hypothetical protein